LHKANRCRIRCAFQQCEREPLAVAQPRFSPRLRSGVRFEGAQHLRMDV